MHKLIYELNTFVSLRLFALKVFSQCLILRILIPTGSRPGIASSKTITESREGVIDAQLFRELNPGQAVSILTLSGHSMDDVVTLKPIYLS
jgi:hypothetical protein